MTERLQKITFAEMRESGVCVVQSFKGKGRDGTVIVLGDDKRVPFISFLYLTDLIRHGPPPLCGTPL